MNFDQFLMYVLGQLFTFLDVVKSAVCLLSKLFIYLVSYLFTFSAISLRCQLFVYVARCLFD